MTINEERVEIIAQEIMRYLIGHPDAADTLNGISQWWLSRIRLEEAVAQVELALARLIQRGVVHESILPDGSTLYRSALKQG